MIRPGILNDVCEDQFIPSEQRHQPIAGGGSTPSLYQRRPMIGLTCGIHSLMNGCGAAEPDMLVTVLRTQATQRIRSCHLEHHTGGLAVARAGIGQCVAAFW